jgi:hypothetical protein
MSENELNRMFWEAYTKRVVGAIEGFAQGWQPNGPAQHVKEAIVNLLKRLPVPQVSEVRQ